MNIRQAKEQIIHTLTAYQTCDEWGEPLIPVPKQRPVFLVGAPGIGKTSIVEQVAREMDIGFVSYAMTHHTRQSALGLPYIVEKTFQDQTYTITEYTMSEIIAACYEEMERTGKNQGILFLDEINCVSETLTPAMLQFLQFKTFGRHQIPKGWMVVTAGNPVEYNRSGHEFDLVTWDRLKKISIEPDYEAWKPYALNTHLHPAIIAYLDLKPQHFYVVETTIDGQEFVTARSWDDLGQMMNLYEKNHLEVNLDLIAQYLQKESIAKDFANYYELFKKYEENFQLDEIFSGAYDQDFVEKCQKAPFDERLSLIALLMSKMTDKLSALLKKEQALQALMRDAAKKNVHEKRDSWYMAYYKKMPETNVKGYFQDILNDLRKESDECQKSLDHVFHFLEEAFGDGQEMLIFVSELTVHDDCALYLYTHPNQSYETHRQRLLFADRREELLEKIARLDLAEH